MKVLYVSIEKEIAVTYDKETGIVEEWTTPTGSKNARLKVFQKTGKKKILESDNGWRWNGLLAGTGEKREASGCFYGSFWYGSFPYGSWCLAIRIDKKNGETETEIIDTEINGRGINPYDAWVQECKDYKASRYSYNPLY